MSLERDASQLQDGRGEQFSLENWRAEVCTSYSSTISIEWYYYGDIPRPSTDILVMCVCAVLCSAQVLEEDLSSAWSVLCGYHGPPKQRSCGV